MAIPVWQPGTLYAPGDLVQPASNPAPVVQALTNAGFEDGDFTGWTVANPGDWDVNNIDPYAGTFKARYDVAAPATDFIEQTAYSNVAAGQQVIASCKVYTQKLALLSTATGRIGIAWYTAANAFISESLAAEFATAAQGWRTSSVTGVAPATAAKARIRLYATRVSEDTGFDSVSWDLVYTEPPGTAIYRATQAAAGYSANVEPVWPGVGFSVVDNQVTWLGVSVSRVVWSASPVLVSGGSEPSFPTTVGLAVLDNTISWVAETGFLEQAPASKSVQIAAKKVFAGDDDIVKFCATVNPRDWTTVDDAGYLPTGINTHGANPTKVLALYRGNLVPMNSAGFQLWQVDPDPQLMALLDAVPIGSVYAKAAQPVANDLLFLTSQGYRNISIAGGSTNLQAGSYGEPIDPLVVAKLQAGTYMPNSVYYPQRGQYWGWFGDEVFVLTLNGTKPSWSRYTFPEVITDATMLNEQLVLRTATGKIWVVSEEALTDDITSDTVTVTIASPAVVSWTAHARANGDTVVFTTSGALPTGLVAGTVYYIVGATTDAFNVAATAGGAAINTSGGQSGVHTAEASVEFTGVVWWPWLDCGSLGGSKRLEAFDAVCDGEVSVQIGYDQRDLAALTTAYVVDGDTLVGMPVPIPLVGPSFSLKLTFSARQAWEVQAANLYLQDNRGGGSTG